MAELKSILEDLSGQKEGDIDDDENPEKDNKRLSIIDFALGEPGMDFSGKAFADVDPAWVELAEQIKVVRDHRAKIT